MTEGNITNSYGVKVNLSQLKAGFESSSSVQWDSISTTTDYENVSVSGWIIVAAACAYFGYQVPLSTGSPAYSN